MATDTMKTRFVNTMLLVWLCTLFSSPTSIAAIDEQSEFRQLEQQFQQAKTKAQFIAVATGYDALKTTDSVSVSIIFNQANAWLKAEELGRAIAGYRQALRLAPRDESIRRNLNLAIQKAGHQSQQPTIMDYAFFWKDRLTISSLAMLITIAIIAAGALFVLNHRSRFSVSVFRFLVVGSLTLFVSFIVKINEEEHTLHGSVVANSTDAKKGPAASYESAFSKPLTDGLEFCVVNQQQDWIEVDVSGIGLGWIPKTDAVVY